VKGAAALALALAAAATVAFVLAFSGSHDATPGKVRDCVRRGGARVIRGQEGLAFALGDVEAGRLKQARRYRLGDDRAVLMSGRGYAVLVVGVASGPPLGGDLARRAYLQTADFAVVATERDPVRGVLDGCARLAG
jgi:hypothetical protein